MRSTPRPSHGLDGVRLETGQDENGRVGEDGTCHHRQSADVRQGQAGQPRVAGGVETQPRGGGPRRSGDGLVGEHDPFGLTRGARGGDDERVALLDGLTVGQGVLLAVGTHDAARSQGVEHGPARHAGQSRVEGCRGVAGVPDGAERIDEAHATGEVECDELGHRQ